MIAANQTKPHQFITLIGLILLLIGIYASARTIINFVAFPKYPSGGVLSPTFMGVPYIGPREEDCILYPPVYSEPGIAFTEEQKTEMKEQAKMQQQSCISSAKDAREQAKVNDISQSILFLVLGGGVLALRKRLFT